MSATLFQGWEMRGTASWTPEVRKRQIREREDSEKSAVS